MIIDIETEDGIQEYSLFNFNYINQRYFATGTNRITGKDKKFITTKGFDQILIACEKGIEFNFTKQHLNPYLCERILPSGQIYRESELIKTAILPIKDMGLSDFSGNYQVIKTNQFYKDDFYFETVSFKVDGFDLFKYQTDDLYFTQHQSTARNKLPQLVNVFDANLYGRINIVHAVSDVGEDYFDLNCLVQICDAELGYPNKNSFYSVIRAAGFDGIFKTYKIGPLEFANLKDIIQFKNDCGNAFIQKNINKKTSKRKYAFRYLYEYFEIIEKLCSNRRKQSIAGKPGIKDHKKEEFLPIFYNQTILEFKIVYFRDINTIERKCSIQKIVPSFDSVFYIDGYYDFNEGHIKYHNFKSTGEIVKKIKEKVSTAASIRFAKVISEWFPNTFGYVPLTIKLKMSQKANASALSNNLTLYTIPIKEDGSDEIFGAETYVNLYEYFANFGVHIPQIRNMLNANRFSKKIFNFLGITFPVYNVCRDTRRKVYEFDEITDQDRELISLMFPVTYGALVIAPILAKSGISKNSYWYSNLNRLTQSLPPGDIISTIYTCKELQEFLAEE
jgi:hypothetical protein